MQGTVKSVLVDRGFGFISVPGRKDLFFHFRDLTNGLQFDEQLRELRVEFEVTNTERGERARCVRRAQH